MADGECREQDHPGRHRSESQPSSRTGENSPYGMIGGIEETSASFEARSAPRSYPIIFFPEAFNCRKNGSLGDRSNFGSKGRSFSMGRAVMLRGSIDSPSSTTRISSRSR